MSRTSVPEPLEPERYELSEEPWFQFEPDRRAFCKALSGGILVCAVFGEVLGAQDPQRQRGRGAGGAAPQELGAWLHIGESGAVTVYTGKVEIGQNVRTSLTQVVAEELRLPVGAISLIMADTEQTPFDAGTFGSQTTPRMASQLRRAAAAARELLVDLAAEKAGVERGTLQLADGRVTDPAGGRSFRFGELTEGKRLTKTVGTEAPVTLPAQWKVAGTSVAKVDGRALVTGAHRYASDVKRPNMLHGKVLRPPTLNATLTSVDLKPAEALADVVAVHDGGFVGVAAPSAARADETLAAVRAEWKSPPEPSDKDLFETLKANVGGQPTAGGRSGFEQGSVETALAAAEHVRRAVYTVAYIAHVPLEPRAAVAEWTGGKLTVWTGTQRPFGVRDELSRAFGLPPEKVRVIVPDTGSGYGGKHTGEAAVEAARLARAAGKPVRVAWTRAEEFTWAYFRPAGLIDVGGGVARDGTLTAWEFHNHNSGASALRTPYEVPHQRVVFHAAKAPLRQGSYRALAATANHFARESHMDELGAAAGLDPLEFRLKNLKEPRLRAVLEAAARQFGWGRAKAEPGRGVGIAGGTEKGSYVATCAEVAAERAGGPVQVVRLVTAFECGAVLNPDHLRNQVEGAVVMGLGGALFEAVRYEGGEILNASFSRYRVPRFGDVPAMETVLLDRKDLPSAGAGETPIVAVAPAIANAVARATGVRPRSMPLTSGGKDG
jgi:isoquinoline 1-oxidoreductase